MDNFDEYLRKGQINTSEKTKIPFEVVFQKGFSFKIYILESVVNA
jgi:hypothetical protein